MRSIIKSAVSLFILTFSLGLAAQNVTVKGTVMDDSNVPLIGATVKVIGTTTGAVTDSNGNYSITAAPDATLEATYLGYISQVIPIAKRAVIDFILKEDSDYLDEVVVVGYGTQKKVNMTGSVSMVNFEEIAKSRPIQTTQQALAGASAGVSVNQASGKPGDENITVRIRGIGTLNSSAPLVIVDGFESNMSAVNADDIATISILKDAASCAIYGNRAANGVILITTKEGSKKKDQVAITYSGIAALNTPMNTYKAVSNYADYMSIMNESAENIGATLPFSQEMINLWREKSLKPNEISESGYPNYIAYPNTDWFDAIYRSAVMQNHNLTASGNTGKTKYLLSASFQDNPGIVNKTEMQQYKMRANISSKLTDWMEVGTKIWGYRSERQLCDIDGASQYFTRGTPNFYPYYDGKYGWSENAEQHTNSRNNLYFIERFDGKEIKNYLNSTLFAKISLPFNIKYNASFNYNYLNTARNYYGNTCNAYSFRLGDWTYFYNDLSRVSQTKSHTDTYSWTFQTNFDWNYTFAKKHEVSALLGFESMYHNTANTAVEMKGFSNDQLKELKNMVNMTSIDGNQSDYSAASVFGRITYAYDSRYLFEANLRYDGSSRFAPESRWGLFPSFSAGWRISQEPWMKNSGFDNLKIRASYGKLGNNSIGNYDYQSTYASSITYPLGGSDSLTSGIVGTLSNNSLTWEVTTSYDLGLEMGVFNNRLTLEADIYDRFTDGILYKGAIPATVGTKSAPYLNLCQVSNKGFEITLGWKDSIGDFNYAISGNFSRNWNRVEKYKGTLEASWTEDEHGHRVYTTNLGEVSTSSDSGRQRVMEGKLIDEWYILNVYSGDGTHFFADGSVNPAGGPRDGMIRTPEDMAWLEAMVAAGSTFLPSKKIAKDGIWYGDMIYADVNGDGIYGDDNDISFQNISTHPKMYFGFNISLDWKGIDFSAQFAGAAAFARYFKEAGRYGYGTRSDLMIPNEIGYDHYFYDPANPEDPRTNTTSVHGRLTMNTGSEQNGGSSAYSTHWLHRGDYLKIKNITLGYTLPSKITSRAKIENLRIFISGENLYTFTKYPLMDPETTSVYNYYPMMRQYSLGLSLTF